MLVKAHVGRLLPALEHHAGLLVQEIEAVLLFAAAVRVEAPGGVFVSHLLLGGMVRNDQVAMVN